MCGLHNCGVRVRSQCVYHGFFAGQIDRDVDNAGHRSQGAFDPTDAGSAGHVFNGIAPVLHCGRVPRGVQCSNDSLGIKPRCHLQCCRLRGKVHAGFLHTIDAAKRRLDPPHARGAIHAAYLKIDRNYIAHSQPPQSVLPLR